MSLLKRGGDDAFEDSLAYVKKQKLSCDYLKKVLQQECGGKIFPKSNIEGLVQQLVDNMAKNEGEPFSNEDQKAGHDEDHKANHGNERPGDVDCHGFLEGEFILKAIKELATDTRSLRHQIETETSAAANREKKLIEKVSNREKELSECRLLVEDLRKTTTSQMTRLERKFDEKTRQSAIFPFPTDKPKQVTKGPCVDSTRVRKRVDVDAPHVRTATEPHHLKTAAAAYTQHYREAPMHRSRKTVQTKVDQP